MTIPWSNQYKADRSKWSNYVKHRQGMGQVHLLRFSKCTNPKRVPYCPLIFFVCGPLIQNSEAVNRTIRRRACSRNPESL